MNATDAALTGLITIHTRIAAAMYELDQHPGLGLLRGGRLTGQTAQRWTTLEPEVARVWAYFSALADIVEQARAIQGRPRLADPGRAELSRLLTGAAVALGPDGLPIDSTAVASTQIGVEELARRLEQELAGVLAQLSEVDAAWSAVASAMAGVSEQVDAAVALALQLGTDTSADPLRAALAEVERIDLRDPLVAAPAGRLTGVTRSRLDALRIATSRTQEDLAELVRLRDGYALRREALVSLVDEVDVAEQGVAAAQQRATEKIANPGLGVVPAAAAVLRARLPALDRLALDAQWQQLAADLSTVKASAIRARDRATELTRVADGLIGRRDELRGRLEAYRAKAAARGLAEHDTLTDRFTRAHDLLYTAPCDLRASTRAVHEYQQTLASVLGERSAVDD